MWLEQKRTTYIYIIIQERKYLQTWEYLALWSHLPHLPRTDHAETWAKKFKF